MNDGPLLNLERHLEHVAIDVAELAASSLALAVGTARVRGTKSSPTDVVTEHDLRSETLIRAELLSRCPGSTVIGEELDDQQGANDIGWIVDPIDGTVNFLYGLPVVAVSIAATLNGEVVAGAVVDVLGRETFSAARGDGARCNGEPISASHVDSLASALVGTGFAYAAELRLQQARTLTRLLPACRDIRCMGSAALNLCWVGCGRLDAFYEGDLKVYDYAAGALVAAEGGAVVQTPVSDDASLTMAAAPLIAVAVRSTVTAAAHR